MKVSELSRHRFIMDSLKSTGLVIVSTGIAVNITTGKDGSAKEKFDHGVTSNHLARSRYFMDTGNIKM
ncbi:MAG: hypothetical protein V4732_16005 [Pseudomonadota bacterium]